MPVISRPLLIALAVAVVAVVGFYATQGARESSETVAPVAPVVPAETAPEPEDVAERGDAPEAPPAAGRRAREKRIGMPLPFARALRGRDTVVLFLRGSGSADERATARAVAGLRGQRGVTVFTDRIGKLGRYRAVVGELGITQAPTVVIVGRGRSARVVEGYIDPTTLAQDVADAR